MTLIFFMQYWPVPDHFPLQRGPLHCQERGDVQHCGAHLSISCRSPHGPFRHQWIAFPGETFFKLALFLDVFATISLIPMGWSVQKQTCMRCLYVDVIQTNWFFCFQRALNHDMPHQDFFSLLRESNAEFLNRTGWFYTHSSPVNMPPDVIVLPPI